MPDDPTQTPPVSPPAAPPPVPPPPESPPFPIQSAEQQSQPVPPPPIDQPPPTPPPGEPAQAPPVAEPFFKRFFPVIIGLIVVILLGLLVTKVILPRFRKAPEPDVVTLDYWGLWEPESIMAKIIEDYRQDHPNITVNYTRQSPKDYRDRLQSALARNEGPDIFRWHNTWLPMLKADLASVPENIYSPNEFDTTFYPIVRRDAFTNGNFYGIPLEFDALALYVNQSIFAQNADLKIPTTWDNLRSTAFKLAQKDAKGNLLVGGIALGTTNNVDHFSDILGLMILQNGGDPTKPDQTTVTSALKFYTLFTTQDGSWNEKLPNSTLAFADEKVAMIFAPSWRALEIKALNPELNFRLYPVPQLPGTNITWATYWLEGVSKKSDSQAAAWDFLKYLSSKETLLKMHDLAGKERLFGEPYPRQDMTAAIQEDPFLGAIITQAVSAQSWPLADRTFDNGLNDRLIKYYQDAINSYLKNEPEKKITDTLSQGVSQVLSQYGLAANK
ncbi:MAG: hypothetical protein UX85_C0001G0024 [Candidatus Beckwithbacteria bacterium GW2011_GWB1_47_15]|uniref:Extracellular solute-binding protein family 1 n=1 Tax=Candidatus Beckwithbacteria bacterium GW2011_GWB1_47_15 TaxID=1618371 RepID=A0A0G1UVR5_9BACT|nr:MAG: ABC-type sugar transport system, periplasmic component [Candidatus Beckwithbacteria bacterium GW2011_GWC1_49_16]AQS30658.1 hypothetical protein [uncultured bacterium]KKU35846.1 MAG: hypothetical protein UX50_C0001G0023 [Candidatus Beckwithbacteria bacterium GW2011_GWA1_46_30]KKU61810.1 MAG: hypothetical protein UX85_C0001G0024 [Candidatus Beckwithbacteria bacterium GW2011_GWB1_47_15]KKU72636.1 MAG: hypothetical protein UX97_C0001G0506 [Candidatus Beckwithbacteria bacterium GW2011_GWA2_4